MANIWDQNNDTVSEYEMVSEDAQQAEQLAKDYASSPLIVEADEEVLEEIAEESAFDLSTTESNVIYNARLRLEQAKLYEMLINHNLFEGVDVSPEAVKTVQNELKFYIVKRLEILLGLREPVAAKPQASVESPFNDIEVDFLKQLAYKGTLGASVNGTPVVAKPAPAIKPLGPAPTAALKPLAPKKVEVKQEQKVAAPAPQAPKAPPAKAIVQQPVAPPPRQAPAPQPKPQAKQPAAPRNKKAQDIVTGVGERRMTDQEALEIAKADLATSSKKPFHEMTAKEKAQRIREANERNARAKPANVAPMPSEAELRMKYMMQQESRTGSKSSMDQFNNAIATVIANQKNRGDDND